MNKLIKYFSLSVISVVFAFVACTEADDYMTGNVLTGGLVEPTLSNVPYKLNATPSFDVSFIVPKGPKISKVELYKFYTVDESTISNESLLATFNVDGKNETEDFTGKVTVNYASLISGLLISGAALPADETKLNIGEFWTIKFVAYMTDGERKVINASTTKVGVANAYAGTYLCVGTFNHPTAGIRAINEEKYLTPLSATTCNIPVGDLGGSGYFVDITVDPITNTVTFSNGTPTDIIASAERSYYEPSTGKFYLHYYYVGGNGPRIIDEVYTPVN